MRLYAPQNIALIGWWNPPVMKRSIKKGLMNHIALYLIILLSIPFNSMLLGGFWHNENWFFVAGVESGAVISSHAGKSITFPSNNPEDEFYEYDCHHKTQTRVNYGGFLGIQWKGCQNWDMQFDVKYCQTSPFSVNGTLTQGLDVQSEDTYEYQYKIALRQLLFEAKFSYVNCSRFKPYAMIGIGSSFNKAYSFSTTVPSLLTFTRVYESHRNSGFSYAIGAGIDFELTQCFYLSLGYRYTDFGRTSLGSASIDDEPVSGTLSQNHFYANQLFAQMTFLF